jgi:uncharacterized protein (DUF1501 family)
LKKAGIYNQMPDLQDLEDGDLKYSIDFRQVYTTLLEQVLQKPSAPILGRNFGKLTFL